MVHSGRDRLDRARAHYALVCYSSEPLALSDHGHLAFGALHNLRSGARIGASQVTAVVVRDEGCSDGPEYQVALRARLVAPYFVVLREPDVIRMGTPGGATADLRTRAAVAP